MFEWIVGIIAAAGLIGVAMLMFAENVFPPLPSEVIMPLAGFVAAQGALSFPGVVAAGSVGALAGACFWFWVGKRAPEEKLRAFTRRHGRWLTLDVEDLDKSQAFFRTHGGWAVFFGRLVPGVRTFISVPAGVMHMPTPTFLVWTALGTALWTLLLASAGYLLAAQFHLVEQWLDPVSTGVLVGLAVFYVYRVATFERRTSGKSNR